MKRTGIIFKTARALLIIILLALVWGCATGDGYFLKTSTNANVFVDKRANKINRVAVVTFKAPTELIGKSVSDLFITEIMRTGEYQVIERTELAAVVGETELALAGVSESRLVAAAKQAGAEAVIFGTVDEFSKDAQGGKTYAVMALSVRMVDCSDGKVLWGASLAERAKSYKVPLAKHGRDVIHRVTAGLYKEWMKYDKKRTRAAPGDIPTVTLVSGIDKMEVKDVSTDGLKEVRISWGRLPEDTKLIRIERARQKDGPYEHVGMGKASSGYYVDDDRDVLEDSSKYFYAVTPSYKDGMPVSPAVIVVGETAPPPEPPSKISGSTPKARVIELKWDPPASRGVEEYVVERKTDGQFEEIATTKHLEYRDGGSRWGDSLKDSTVYTYRIYSINEVDSKSVPSDPVEVTTRPPPRMVVGLEIKESLIRAISLQWVQNPEDDIEKYEVYRSGSKDGPYEEIETLKGTENTTMIDGEKEPGSLENDAAYWYRTVAVNEVGARSEMCEPVQGRTRGPIPPIEALSVQGGLPKSVMLEWEQPDDPKLGEFIIRRRPGDGGAWTEVVTLNKDENSYLDKGKDGLKDMGILEDGIEYEYQMAVTDIGDYFGEWSKSVKAVTKPAPGAPSDVAATTNEVRKIKISWTKPPEADIDGYEVFMSETGEAKYDKLAAVDVEEYVHEDLEPGDVFFYKVMAVDETGLVSELSGAAIGSSRDLPMAPIDVKLSNDGAALTWDVSEGSRAESFNVWKKTLFSWEIHKVVTGQLFYKLTPEDKAAKLRFSVSALDKDELESERAGDVQVGE